MTSILDSSDIFATRAGTDGDKIGSESRGRYDEK
jgi:hypothetical protein